MTVSVKSVSISGGENASAITILQKKAGKDIKYHVQRDDEGLVEYVQDPESQGLPIHLLKVENEPDLHFTFTFVLKQSSLSGVTFVTGTNLSAIERLITSGYNADSNIQKNKNVKVLGDYRSDTGDLEIQYTWKWAPSDSSIVPGMLGGWKSVCSFSEFIKAENRFSTLAAFSFWIHDVPRDDLGSLPIPTRPSRLQLPSFSSTAGSPAMRAESPELMTPLESEHPTFFGNMANLSIGNPASPLNAAPPTTTSVISNDAQLPEGNLEDGPVFRATLNELEGKTAAFRFRVKKVMKRAAELKEIYREWRRANIRLTESIQAIASEKASLKPVMDTYINVAFRKLSEFRDYDDTILGSEIIEPLRRIYDHDIKAAEGKKREFEDESRDYYAFLGRYLSKKNDASQKKLMEKDSKYTTKKKNFELKRFDYYCYVQDLHGGRKEQDVLRQMTIYAEKQSDCLLQTAEVIRELKPSLEALSQGVENARNELKLVRTEREVQRRNIEKTANSKTDTDTQQGLTLERSVSHVHSAQGSQTADERTREPSALGSAFSPKLGATDYGLSPEKQPLEQPLAETQRKKEGILWALNKPGSHVDPSVGVQKLNWHKFWVTLGNGQITEYRDWKEGVKHSGEPIDLRLATVRIARNTDRRFCFEVITPQLKRVYQTTSEEELDSWIKHIVSAIEGILDGSGSRRSDANRQQHNNQVKQSGGNAQAIFFGGLHSRTRLSIARELTANNNANTASPAHEDARRILNLVRDADPAFNSSCADCGGSNKVEWCSINLGVILCIECSGIHRGLGSHITKVRSLTLDTNSFNPDLVDLLCRIGNRVSNSIYEATLSRYDASMKPTDRSTHESKLRYITAKYVDRTFVDYPSISPNDVLLGSLSTNNVAAAYSALASRADPNMVDEKTALPAVILSLLTTSPPSSPSKEVKSGEWRDESNNTFPLTELLLHNGGELTAQVNDSDVQRRMSINAKNYVNSKLNRGLTSPSGTSQHYDTLSNSPGGPRPSQPALNRTASNGNSLVSGLQKRISSGGFSRRT
ncbi:putative ARF GTPase activator [Taphrina deformans PYCC 5710]|uniref:ADP-ribosylation factor GTPase-activating protein n=1 Tax=Taphrina deformans (strain PYCC 5710 / ATCC 11124 / CBS 356.35 / IMI 108563 / JCM 9778 / NBRC 8474) TaxID=1097556 RepID=R4XHR0_TAPDE|nr:putative ARF GTPase activator [Taphrina deformans PYCC 5710]|eukprot:CCG85184.1 putative ARF GTPase activator [Taphrina deformans PYCC 5710]